MRIPFSTAQPPVGSYLSSCREDTNLDKLLTMCKDEANNLHIAGRCQAVSEDCAEPVLVEARGRRLLRRHGSGWSAVGLRTAIRSSGLVPKVHTDSTLSLIEEGDSLTPESPTTERRRWARLALAIPVFVRSRDDRGKEFLEFATALNIGAGGALVAVRRPLAQSERVLMEIPCAPLAAAITLPKASRTLRARTVHVTHANGYHLAGLKFYKPLRSDGAQLRRTRGRKVGSPV